MFSYSVRSPKRIGTIDMGAKDVIQNPINRLKQIIGASLVFITNSQNFTPADLKSTADPPIRLG